MYQCTFCAILKKSAIGTKTFSNCGNWTRHEDDCHLVLTEWVCSPSTVLAGPSPTDSASPTDPAPTDPSPTDPPTDPVSQELALADSVTEVCNFCQKPPAESNCADKCAPTCSKKRTQERTFSRKGHLHQHLERVHKVTKENLRNPIYKTWSSRRAPPTSSRCGFCDGAFDSWKKRNKHIAEHFEEGKTMDQWNGGLGLSAEWMQRVDLNNQTELEE